MKKAIKQFLINNPDFTFSLLSKRYPFSKEMMKKHRFWGSFIYMNESLRWGEEIFEFKEIYWDYLVKSSYWNTEEGKPIKAYWTQEEKEKSFWKALRYLPKQDTLVQKYPKELGRKDFSNLYNEAWLKENDKELDWRNRGYLFFEERANFNPEFLAYLESKIYWREKQEKVKTLKEKRRRISIKDQEDIPLNQIDSKSICSDVAYFLNKSPQYFTEEQENEPCSVQFIKKYKDKLDFDIIGLSIDWTKTHFKCFEALTDMKSMRFWKYEYRHSRIDRKLIWDMTSLRKYQEELNWSGFSERGKFPLTIEFFQEFKDKIDWNVLYKNPLLHPYNSFFINQCKQKEEYDLLVISKEKFTSIDFVEEHLLHISFDKLSKLQIPFDTEFLRFYQHSLEWLYIGSNAKIKWTTELVDEFDEYLPQTFWSNYNVDFSEKFLRKYAYRIRIDSDMDYGIWWQEDLKWNLTKLELIKPHMRKWEFNHISFDDKIYQQVFEPYLDDTFVEEILEAINDQTPPVEMIIKNSQ